MYGRTALVGAGLSPGLCDETVNAYARRAVASREADGDSDVLHYEEAPRPVPSPTQVLAKVAATSFPGVHVASIIAEVVVTVQD